MNSIAVRAMTAADLPHVLGLLRDADLITSGVEDHLPGFLVAAEGDTLVGSAGLEIYGDVALLRSVAVAAPLRGQGLGGKLVAAALDRARRLGIAEVVLLTSTAAAFFRRLGFHEVDRQALDPRLSASEEFGDECCATAVAMTLDLRAPARSAGAPTTPEDVR